jgi:4'-phosphopantetheinyl transferase
MLTVFYTHSNITWSDDTLNEKLLQLPANIRNKIMAYTYWQDQQLRINSKLLLTALLKHFQLDNIVTLDDLHYTPANRPFFDINFDFSTAHSGNISICAGSMQGSVGIDIEHIKPVDVNDYKEQFTDNEWAFLMRAADKNMAFYTLWTRKEALLKAIGSGVHIPFSSVDVTKEFAHYGNKMYYLYPIHIDTNYIAHVASDAVQNMIEVRFDEL